MVLAITVLAAALRFVTITGQSYWFDEATTAHEMQLSFGAMLHAMSTNESTPPLYYVLAWVWARVFGVGEAGLRSLSALAGTAIVPVAYLCGRELVSRAAGYVAATFAAVSPFLIWYSQEARAYMLFAALCALSLLFFARAWRVPSRRNIVLWAVGSALAVLTHFFAVFIVGPEALWLLWTLRTRVVVLASTALAAVQLAVLPLALGDLSHPLLGWLKQFPLHVRIEQVPIALGLNTLYQSALVNDSLLVGGVLAAVAVILLIFGANRHERQGAGVAAGLAACVLLVPLLLALFGRDYYIARNLIPAWIPLAVVLGAACTAQRTLPAGLALAALTAGAFVYTGFYINAHPQYQRPDWRGVAHALGASGRPRAVVAYDGEVAAQPLSLYLPGAAWNPPPPSVPVTVSELDVVGNTWQTLSRSLPPGIRLIASKSVNSYQVDRFALAQPWHASPALIAARAGQLLQPAPAGAAVLVQQPARRA